MFWSTEEIERVMEERRKAFLHAAGNLAQNQMAEFAHIKDGVLKNSINYKTDGKWSGFSTQHGDPAPSDAEVSNPQKDYVRVGSALVYAGPQERHNGFASKTVDEIRGTGALIDLAKKVFQL